MHVQRRGTVRLAVLGAALALLLAACGDDATEEDVGATGNEPSGTTMSGDNIGDASAPPEEPGDTAAQPGQQ